MKKLKNHSLVDCDRPPYIGVNASAASAAISLETRLMMVCYGRRRGADGTESVPFAWQRRRDGGVVVAYSRADIIWRFGPNIQVLSLSTHTKLHMLLAFHQCCASAV